jgi:probable HAF family extracellular repeat protein
VFKPIGVALVASAFFVVAAHAELTYRIYPLGDLDEGGQTSANAVNTHGSVAGVTPIDGKPAAVVWNEGIATHIPLGPDQTEVANGINNAGTVVGMIVQNDFTQHAYSWNGKSVTLLPGLDAQATAINNAGEIAGYTTAKGAQQATIWNGGQATVLDIPGAIQSSVNAINNHGDVVGDYFDGTSTHAFIDHNGKISELLSADASGNAAIAINDKDQVVVKSTGKFFTDAVRWQNGALQQQSTPLSGGNFVEAYGINDSGSIVGFSAAAGPTLWNEGVPTNLNTLLPANSGWQIGGADAINNRGQIIGIGDFKHQTETFIMTPSSQAIPLPSPLLIGLTTFPLAMLAMRMFRDRRHFTGLGR